MPRRMSVSLTVDSVVARTKTVTRRHVDTWRTLKPWDRLTLVEKGMGLRKGEHQRVLAEVEIIDVRVEPITAIRNEGDGTDGAPDQLGVEREGLAREMSGHLFAYWWAASHGHPDADNEDALDEVYCRRIEWRYL